MFEVPPIEAQYNFINKNRKHYKIDELYLNYIEQLKRIECEEQNNDESLKDNKQNETEETNSRTSVKKTKKIISHEVVNSSIKFLTDFFLKNLTCYEEMFKLITDVTFSKF